MSVTVAEIDDPLGSGKAELKKDARGKYYITSKLGMYKLQNDEGQKWAKNLLKKISVTPPETETLEQNESSEKPAEKPAEKKRGWLDSLFD